jgi:hypothetical protein
MAHEVDPIDAGMYGRCTGVLIRVRAIGIGHRNALRLRM